MFNPGIHTATNKPIGLIGKPADARSYYYDAVNFAYRAYVNIAEVLAYLDTDADRVGQFSIIINTSGSLSGGTITGGINSEWWFKDGTADANLVLKSTGAGPVSTTTITAGTTATPLVKTYDDTLYPSPKYALIRADGSYDWNTRVTWVSGTFTVVGEPDGSGKFLDSFTFYILP